MDSVLFSLFHDNNEYIKHHILDKNIKDIKLNRECDSDPKKDLEYTKNILVEIKNIAKSIQGTGDRINYCTNLRKLMKLCDRTNKFSTKEQEEAQEFVESLFSIFDVESTTLMGRMTYGSNDKNKKVNPISLVPTSDERIEIYTSPIILCPNQEIKTKNNSQELLNIEDDSGILSEDDLFKPWKDDGNYTSFCRRIQKTTVIDAPYLILYLERGGIDKGKNKFYRNEIIPDPEITLESGKKLNLTSIVIKSGEVDSGHYTCYYKCKDEWYFYNDLSSTIKEIGSYKNLLKNKNTKTSSTLLFYT